MEMENLLKLIDKVSGSKINEFSYEEGSLKLYLKKEAQEVIVKEVENHTVSTPAKETAVTEGNVMKSPLVGTFYNSPSPDAEAFVKVGDTVKKGQVLGIIEAMKLMNEIECEFDGTLEEILVDNETMVEYGQPLFVIR